MEVFFQLGQKLTELKPCAEDYNVAKSWVKPRVSLALQYFGYRDGIGDANKETKHARADAAAKAELRKSV